MKVTLIEPNHRKTCFQYSKHAPPGTAYPGTLLQESGHQVRLIMGSSRDIHLSEIAGADLVYIHHNIHGCWLSPG